MDTKSLKSFIIAAKNKSFQKAAEQLFLSSTALIKQINSLEDELGFKLFIRTNKGIFLTDAGKVFYTASEDILRRCSNAIQSARDRCVQKAEPIRIGFSPVNPYQNVPHSYLYKSENFYENSSEQFINTMVPISGEFKEFMDEIRNIGSSVDMIPYFFGNKTIEPFCQKFCLAKLWMCAAVPIDHPLADKAVIGFEDLDGCDLITLADNVNTYYGVFNDIIKKKAPQVNLIPINFIDFSALNETVSRNSLLLVGEYLRDVHPLLKIIPLEEEMLLPYGLYYANDPSPGVIQLFEWFRDNGVTGSVDDAPVVRLK